MKNWTESPKKKVDCLIQVLTTEHKYKVQHLYPGVLTDISMVVEFLGAIKLPMILSISNKGPQGFSKMNHVIGIYRNNIIDGEYTHNRILNEENLHLACGEMSNSTGCAKDSYWFHQKQ